ncbi:hypothetical protein O181_028000 [Austropuccinia psidii MF-1]|uniref:Uncharacterized protein n=1 Tax=Austropuccinia psidii MF-1 TaxID=1389203 RepID=A0A9Q3CSF6_9BASI|nr:hypothetical protein [Austropuccinia psidii MF-1]
MSQEPVKKGQIETIDHPNDAGTDQCSWLISSMSAGEGTNQGPSHIHEPNIHLQSHASEPAEEDMVATRSGPSQDNGIFEGDLGTSPQNRCLDQVLKPKQRRMQRTKKELEEDMLRKQQGQLSEESPGKAKNDRNPPFVQMDFENICTYLENKENYHDLFGDSKKTSWGKKKHTRAQAFKRFALYLNVHHHNGMLRLSGRNLQQRWCTYKRKFVETSQFLQRTGSGLIEGDTQTLKEEIEHRCPCYDRMQAIFGNKQNVVGFNVLDTTNTEVGEDSDENKEVNSDKNMEKLSNSPPQTEIEDCNSISCQNDYMHNEKRQRDKGPSHSDDSNTSSGP